MTTLDWIELMVNAASPFTTRKRAEELANNLAMCNPRDADDPIDYLCDTVHRRIRDFGMPCTDSAELVRSLCKAWVAGEPDYGYQDATS